MWDIPKLVLLQRAHNAIRDGRLDEAYDIVTREDLREYRKCQVLQEKLAPLYLARARKHLETRNLEEALADVRRAVKAGGKRPTAVSLEEEILASIETDKGAQNARKRRVDSARRHLDAGRLEEAAKRLHDLPEALDAARSQIRQDLNLRRESADVSRKKVLDFLGSGDVLAALEAFETLRNVAAGETKTSEIEGACLRATEAAARTAFSEGNLADLRRLIGAASRALSSTSSLVEITDTLELCDRCARAVEDGSWGQARVIISRLERKHPAAKWLHAGRKQLRTLEDTMRDLRSGPLGSYASACAQELGVGGSFAEAAANREPAHVAAARSDNGLYLLWVDGIGTYLVSTRASVSIGRAGSSARPDIELAADLEGVHAQILRVEHDYFIVARGSVQLKGSPIDRHLLADGDKITLGKRYRLEFLLPSKMSSTAILALGTRLRLAGDVRKVILLDEHLIFGSNDGHLLVPKLEGRVILSCKDGQFFAKSEEPMRVAETELKQDQPLPLDTTIEANELRFTLTAMSREGEGE